MSWVSLDQWIEPNTQQMECGAVFYISYQYVGDIDVCTFTQRHAIHNNYQWYDCMIRQ